VNLAAGENRLDVDFGYRPPEPPTTTSTTLAPPPTTTTTLPPTPPEQCDDGVDDDGDGLVDTADPDCCTPATLTLSPAVVRRNAGGKAGSLKLRGMLSGGEPVDPTAVSVALQAAAAPGVFADCVLPPGSLTAQGKNTVGSNGDHAHPASTPTLAWLRLRAQFTSTCRVGARPGAPARPTTRSALREAPVERRGVAI
jgi:hypothetical protein